MPDTPAIEVLSPVSTTLAEQGLDERWLENWLQQDPSRLGLGSTVRIVRAQVNQHRSGGRLDLQAVDDAIENRVYDIELMRGELDADHGFRVLDYWAREQHEDEDDRDHRPVIVAEKLRSSRYRLLLDLLAQRLGLIGIEVRCMVVGERRIVFLDPVVLPPDLQDDSSGSVRPPTSGLSEDDWKAKTTKEFFSFVGTFRESARSAGMKHRVVWSAKSYIGLWRGSRCWCPIWPRKDASARVYLPCPTDWSPGSGTAAPEEFETTRAALSSAGIEAVWAWSYNQGANPIALTIRLEHLSKPVFTELLQKSWQAMTLS